jgi:hypothetical protein
VYWKEQAPSKSSKVWFSQSLPFYLVAKKFFNGDATAMFASDAYKNLKTLKEITKQAKIDAGDNNEVNIRLAAIRKRLISEQPAGTTLPQVEVQVVEEMEEEQE